MNSGIKSPKINHQKTKKKHPYQQFITSKKELNRDLVSKGRLEVERAESYQQVIKIEFQTLLIRILSFSALKLEKSLLQEDHQKYIRPQFYDT
jgi:hypothetical protein